MTADGRTRLLADRTEAVSDGNTSRNLKAFSSARSVGKPVTQWLFESSEVIRLAECKLRLGAIDAELLTGDRLCSQMTWCGGGSTHSAEHDGWFRRDGSCASP
jgi:hypothetical protein